MEKSVELAIKSRNYVSKSDFKVARNCATKLYYKKQGYPTSVLDNAYMDMLAEGGYMVGKYAQLLHPGGIEIGTEKGLAYAVEETMKFLERPSVTLFEAAIYHEHKLVRIDVLVKNGNHFDLIEVKSKSFQSHDDQYDEDKTATDFYTKKGKISSAWQPYVEDVAYQTYVLKNVFPGADIQSYLMMPDKSKKTKIDGLVNWFHIKREGKQIEVTFTGDEQKIREDNILEKKDVTKEVQDMEHMIEKELDVLTPSIKENFNKITAPLTKDCRDCEFRASAEDTRDGYGECWGSLADVKPHLFDLYQITRKKDLVNSLISAKRVSMYDVPEHEFTKKIGERQLLQTQCTREDKEWIDPHLIHLVQHALYPLAFMDFETSRVALPYHINMAPYENVAFQFSVHIIDEPGAEPRHFEWINTDEPFPNFDFARALMEAVGDAPTILVWASHENTILRDIHHQMDVYGENDPELGRWLNSVIHHDEEHIGRITDMNKLCREYYFHPMMGRLTSLKYVLPAVWTQNKALHKIPWLQKYYREDHGMAINPYDTLPKIEFSAEGEVVKEGGGAMMAYQEMMYGQSRNNIEAKNVWKKLLLQYCELDTAAMMMVWKHWSS